MPLSFRDALQNTSSKKLMFAKYKLLKELYGWISAGSAYPDIWYEDISDITDILSCDEDEIAMVEAASLAALDAQSTASVGAFYWDAMEGRVYVKPKADSGADVFTFLYIATVLLTFSKDGGDHDSLPYEARVSDVPTASLHVSEIFDGKVSPLGTGQIKVHNTDHLFGRKDLEPDGEIEMVTAIEIGADID